MTSRPTEGGYFFARFLNLFSIFLKNILKNQNLFLNLPCNNKALTNMANTVSAKMVKAFDRFDADLENFFKRTDGDGTLYEDACTTRSVRGFRLYLNGKLYWTEDGKREVEQMFDDDEARDFLKFWKACLRRAIRYWEMDTETLDKIQDGEIEDKENEED